MAGGPERADVLRREVADVSPVWICRRAGAGLGTGGKQGPHSLGGTAAGTAGGWGAAVFVGGGRGGLEE